MRTQKTASQSILGLVMAALLNLSTTAAYQVPICEQGLYVILSVNRAPHSSDDVRRFSTGVLLNLCQHPANRTRHVLLSFEGVYFGAHKEYFVEAF